MWLYTDLLQALKGERLSSVFSPDGTLISASAAPHCGGKEKRVQATKKKKKKFKKKEREREEGAGYKQTKQTKV